ncbi:Rz-like lysis protein [Pseudomonas phage 10P302A]|uniref:Rz-like lysis protein n=1 Tax=Pseudomonas phage 10P302A TaxID=3038233 RepID=A0AAF0GP72_9CAUD|nr:Rz-like lysis protein [Pseudomonas phage 10P302A]
MLQLKEFIMWGFLVLAGAGLIYAKGHSDATESLTIQHQAEQLAAVRQLEVERETTQRALAEVSKNWQDYLSTSKASADRTIADLRDRGIGLQVKLNDSIVSCVKRDGGLITDGRAELHPDTSRFLVEQAQRADAQVRGLQATVRSLQGGKHE